MSRLRSLISGDYPSLLEAALKEIRWDELQAIQGREIDGWYHGLGLSCFSESGAGGATEQARDQARIRWDTRSFCRGD